jgi:hypothetical protein
MVFTSSLTNLFGNKGFIVVVVVVVVVVFKFITLLLNDALRTHKVHIWVSCSLLPLKSQYNPLPRNLDKLKHKDCSDRSRPLHIKGTMVF